MKLAATAVLLMLATACGYHVSNGTSSLLPSTIKTVAVPAFGNLTTRYKLTDRLPEAISRELITRTRYRPVSDQSTADAILRGSVISYSSNATIFDTGTNRAAAVDLRVILQLTLVERATGKVLLSRPNFEMRERYQIATDPAQYFDESDDALDRASRTVARTIVTAILQSF